MGLIQDRSQEVTRKEDLVKNHCMCGHFEEDQHYYTVTFPYGFFPDGVRASKDVGKTVALEKMLIVMERIWIESYPYRLPL